MMSLLLHTVQGLYPSRCLLAVDLVRPNPNFPYGCWSFQWSSLWLSSGLWATVHPAVIHLVSICVWPMIVMYHGSRRQGVWPKAVISRMLLQARSLTYTSLTGNLLFIESWLYARRGLSVLYCLFLFSTNMIPSVLERKLRLSGVNWFVLTHKSQRVHPSLAHSNIIYFFFFFYS